MHIRQRRSPLLFLLLPILVPINARSVSELGSSLEAPEQAGSVTIPTNPVLETIVLPSGKANPVGTKHAPFDGKDGRPHDGPFVETEAARDRKKGKGTGDEEPASKPLTGPNSDQYSKGDLPESHDGVMNDPDRPGPKEGTRGTEGGVSEKGKDSFSAEKVPDPPKEARPLPHSEEEKIKTHEGQQQDSSESGGEDKKEDKQLLEKPGDLPEISHEIPSSDKLSSSKDSTTSSGKDTDYKYQKPASSSSKDTNAVIQPMHSLFLSFTMILFSEIGDKTFLVAALMAMRHPRAVVFTAAFSALFTMTILSAVLGHAVPTLISKSATNFAAAGLFLVFGVKMLLEARKISPDEGVSEEMKEVEMELEEKEHQQRRMSRRRSSITPYVLESGRGVRKAKSSSRLPSPPESPSSSSSRDTSPSRRSAISNALSGINNLFSLLLSPAWVQTFVMTFLGEWGDRSQIATIAMAAGQDYWWVTAGALVGHSICTAAAVIGGRAIAGRVSLKVVTMGGAIAFLVFGFIYLFEAVY